MIVRIANREDHDQTASSDVEALRKIFNVDISRFKVGLAYVKKLIFLNKLTVSCTLKSF